MEICMPLYGTFYFFLFLKILSSYTPTLTFFPCAQTKAFFNPMVLKVEEVDVAITMRGKAEALIVLC